MAATNPYIEMFSQLIGNQQKGKTAPISDVGSLLGAFSAGKKSDRIQAGELEGTENTINQNADSLYNTQMVAAQTARNQNEDDALGKLYTTAYLKGGGAGTFAPPQLSLGGRAINMPNLGFGPRAASAEQMAAASSLEPMLQARLASGGSYLPTKPSGSDLSEYQKPGLQENIGSYGGTAAGILGAIPGASNWLTKLLGGGGQGGDGAMDEDPGSIQSIMGGQSGGKELVSAGLGLGKKLLGMGGSKSGGIPSMPWTLAKDANKLPLPPGMAGSGGRMASGVTNTIGKKVLPVAGIALGTYGLLKDRGKMGNAMNGAQVGSGIGTLIAPGVGTAVGAGIGALVGLGRGLIGKKGPSKDELAARTASGSLIANVIQNATPQQRAEAQGAGWPKPEEALANIVLRDRTIAQGGTEADASALMNSIYDARKKDPNAVAGASSAINRLMGTGTTAGPVDTTGRPTPGRPAGW